MALGYDRWLSSYNVAVCEVVRQYSREEREDAVARGRLPGMNL